MSKPLERFAVFSRYKGYVQYSLLLFENLGFQGVWETIKQRKSGTKTPKNKVTFIPRNFRRSHHGQTTQKQPKLELQNKCYSRLRELKQRIRSMLTRRSGTYIGCSKLNRNCSARRLFNLVKFWTFAYRNLQ